MNRLFASVVPVLSLAQSDDVEGVMLLQRHVSKTDLQQSQPMPGMLDEIPAERIPAVAGYTQAAKTSFAGQAFCNVGMLVANSVTECTDKCNSEPECGGFGMPDGMLMAPLGAPVQYACYFGCMDGEPSSSRGTYAYYKTERTTTTTTSSTLYIWRPGPPYSCDGGWTEEKVKWCCENKADFPEKEKYCPDQPAAVDDPHITSVSGKKFDVYKPGDHEFLVLPEGASPETADLYISGKVKKIGERENDLWIRKLKVQGKWVEDGPYEFKTSDKPFGKTKSALIRFGASKTWKAMDKTNLNSNLHVVSAVDKKAPEVDFAQSVSKKLELKTGSVKVLIDFATSQKNGKDINHLDLHLKGLKSSQMKSMGGLFAGDVAALQLTK